MLMFLWVLCTAFFLPNFKNPFVVVGGFCFLEVHFYCKAHLICGTFHAVPKPGRTGAFKGPSGVDLGKRGRSAERLQCRSCDSRPAVVPPALDGSLGLTAEPLATHFPAFLPLLPFCQHSKLCPLEAVMGYHGSSDRSRFQREDVWVLWAKCSSGGWTMKTVIGVEDLE